MKVRDLLLLRGSDGSLTILLADFLKSDEVLANASGSSLVAFLCDIYGDSSAKSIDLIDNLFHDF